MSATVVGECRCVVVTDERTGEAKTWRCDPHAEADLSRLLQQLRMGTTTESRKWLEEEAEAETLIVQPDPAARESLSPLASLLGLKPREGAYEGFHRKGTHGGKVGSATRSYREDGTDDVAVDDSYISERVRRYDDRKWDKVDVLCYHCPTCGDLDADEVPMLDKDDGTGKLHCTSRGCNEVVTLGPRGAVVAA